MDRRNFQVELEAIIAGTRREFWSPDNLKIYGDDPDKGRPENSRGASGGSKNSHSSRGGQPSESSGKVPIHKASSGQLNDAGIGRRRPQEMDESEVTSSSSSVGDGEDETQVSELDLLVQEDDRRFKQLHPAENQTKPKKRRNEKSGKYKCKFCGQRFKRRGDLNQHVPIHGGERKFSCDICDKSFKYTRTLSQHMKIHVSKLSYDCHICDYSTKWKYNLSQHLKLHSKKTNCKCERCPKAYKGRDASRLYRSAHSFDAPFQCEKCNCGCKSKERLKKHRNVNEEVKCEVFIKGFKYSGVLKRHSGIHSNDKLFPCNKCYKAFNHKSNLKQHERIHAHERPYVCVDSSNSLTQLSSLNTSRRICQKLDSRIKDISEGEDCFLTSGNLTETSTSTINPDIEDKMDESEVTPSSSSEGETGETTPMSELDLLVQEYDRRLKQAQQYKRIDTGKRTFFCWDCTKGFSRSSSLNRHRRVCPKLDFRVKDLPEEDFSPPNGNLIDTSSSTIYPDNDEENTKFITLNEEGADDAAPGAEDLDGTDTGRVIQVAPSSSRT